jgi:UDP-N-acetylmuramate--alanine ligase
VKLVLGNVRAAHFVGIGGSGMSGIAEVLVRQGLRVSGSDAEASATTARLEALGADVKVGHAAANVPDGTDVVVVSSAVPVGNPEVAEAVRRDVPIVRRGAMLAALMRPAFGIAIAGAHGKTTTTTMIAEVLEHAGLDPTAIVGARVRAFEGNARVGDSEYLVAEADESDRSFLELAPAVAVVTNVDHEHLESYQTFEDLLVAFREFASRPPFFGATVLGIDDPELRRMAADLRGRVITYGIDDTSATFGATEFVVDERGSRAVVVERDKLGTRRLGELHLPVIGRHTVQNALAAVAVARLLDVPFDTIRDALAGFTGADRRFEHKGERRGVRVVDDYGHHPTEIAAVIAAARASGARRVIVAFQPHRYTRTSQLRDAFAAALAEADAIVLTDIYPAGEPPIPGVTIEWLAEAVARAAPGRTSLAPTLDDVPGVVAELAREGDLVITLGAGSIGSSGTRILEEIASCG